SLDVAFTVPTKPSLRSRRPREQRITLIEADRVNAQTDLLGDNTNLHDLNSSPESYTLEYSPESRDFSGAWNCRGVASRGAGAPRAARIGAAGLESGLHVRVHSRIQRNAARCLFPAYAAFA